MCRAGRYPTKQKPWEITAAEIKFYVREFENDYRIILGECRDTQDSVSIPKMAFQSVAPVRPFVEPYCCCRLGKGASLGFAAVERWFDLATWGSTKPAELIWEAQV